MKTTAAMTLLLMSGASAATNNCGTTHTVGNYDTTCDKLMSWYKITKPRLYRLNDGLDCTHNIPVSTNICLSEPVDADCKRTHKVTEYYNATDIAKVFDLPVEKLLEMNPKIKSKEEALNKGRLICLSKTEGVPTCATQHTVGNYDTTCQKIQTSYGISKERLYRLNKQIDCSTGVNLPVSTTVCLSEPAEADCKRVHKVTEFRTTEKLAEVFKIDHNELVAMNPNLKKDPEINKGKLICLSKQADTFTCATQHTVGNYDTTCQKIQTTYGISKERLYRLNKQIDCSTGVNLPVSMAVCLSEPAEADCKRVHKVTLFRTTQKIAEIFGTTNDELLAMNPNLKFDSELNKGKLLCVSKTEGVPKCGTHITVGNYDTTCDKLVSVYKISKETLYKLNKDIDCSTGVNLPVSTNVCISLPVTTNCQRTYKVAEFTNLADIAEVYELTVEDLLKWNPEAKRDEEFHVGRLICIDQ